MSTEYSVKPLHEYPTIDQAQAGAQAQANAEMSYALPGNFYEQGGRRFISFVLPLDKLFKLTVQPERPKKGTPQARSCHNTPASSGWKSCARDYDVSSQECDISHFAHHCQFE